MDDDNDDDKGSVGWWRQDQQQQILLDDDDDDDDDIATIEQLIYQKEIEWAQDTMERYRRRSKRGSSYHLFNKDDTINIFTQEWAVDSIKFLQQQQQTSNELNPMKRSLRGSLQYDQ
eukprot:scaffold2455_cov53-Cylindrotheca_fusiformis.AAC.1